MNCTISFLLTLLLLVLAFPFPVSGQVAIGMPPFGSFGGGPDVINLGNLNSRLTIPVLRKTGRAGMNFTYDLNYDSSVWYPTGGGWQHVGNWGWGTNQVGFTGSITYFAEQAYCSADASYYFQYYDFWYADPYGISHHFSFEGVNTYISSDPNCGATSGSRIAADDSGLKLTVSGWPRGLSATIITSIGQTITPSIQGETVGTVTETDRNGNQLSLSPLGVFTDTLGTTALSVSGSGTPSSPMTFNYTAPSGAGVGYTVKYTTYSLQTNFGCSSIAEYGTNGTSTANLVSEIDLPDGSKYTFGYESTPFHSGFITGRLASVTLPTGGTISYSYSGGSNGIVCADGSTATLTRTTPDGTWTYAHSESGTAWTTLITDPQGNQSNLNFQGIYETQRQVYQGGVSPSNLLKTVNTCYNGSTSPCTGTSVSLPITQRAVVPQFPSGLQAIYIYNYNSSGFLTNEYDHDYGPGGSNPLNRELDITFAALGNNITAFRQQVTVKDGSGNIKARTNYNYDETTPTATSGISQHISVSGSRGNLTSVNYPVSGLTSHFTYYDTGSPKTSQDVSGATTTYNYGSNAADCQMAFPTSISEPLSLSRSMSWNCTGGVQLTTTDENNQTVTASYSDPYFWRPASVTDPLNNSTTFYYQPNPTYCCPSAVAASLSFNNGNSLTEDLQYKDGLGRTYVDQHPQSPGSSTLDSVSYAFDSKGRPYSVSVPCAIGYAATCSTPKTTQTYDALDRPLVTTDGGGGTVSYSYFNNDILVTVGPAPSGENTKRHQLEYDALGRLTSVCELTGASGSGTCGQSTTQTGYWTKYSYDALGNLLTVTQNAQASSGSQQTRSYSYDAMSRLTSETNPESGTKTYVYDTDSTMCGNGPSNSNGDLLKTTDAAGNCVMRYYDALHRLTDVGSPSGCKRFRYDNTGGVLGSKPSGVSVSNALGRLAEAETDTCASPITQSSIITDEWFSYTARGETSDSYVSTLHSGTYYHVNQTYWTNGAPNVLGNNIVGLPAFTYGADGEGRTGTVSASSGQNPVTGTSYNASSLPTQVNFGSGDSDIFAYDSNTLRMTQFKFNVGAQPQSYIGGLTWNANGTVSQLAITDPFNSADAQTCNYSHDDLTRVASANCGSAAAQTFSFDPFGNLSKSGSPYSFNPTYSTSTNRMTSVGSFTPTYDANGNVTNDSLHTYSWDADGNSVTADGVALTFDALDRMVEQNRSGAYTQVVYTPTGAKLALMNGQSLVRAFIPLPGQATAVYTSSGLDHYRHSDWLGSARLTSSPSQSYISSVAYAPFGETYAQSGTADLSFTGQNPDTTSGDYDFLFREYSIQGRWASPDPAGLGSVNPTNPQSWNRYAYVLNNPLSFIDPSGLQCVWDDGSFDAEDDPDTGSSTSCTSAGGTWIDPGFFSDFGLPDWTGSANGDLAAVVAGLQAGFALVQTGSGLSGWMLVANGGAGPIDWSLLGPPVPTLTYNQQAVNAIHNTFSKFPRVCGGGGFGIFPVLPGLSVIVNADSTEGLSAGVLRTPSGGQPATSPGPGVEVTGNQSGLQASTLVFVPSPAAPEAGYFAAMPLQSPGNVSSAGVYAGLPNGKADVGLYANVQNFYTKCK